MKQRWRVGVALGPCFAGLLGAARVGAEPLAEEWALGAVAQAQTYPQPYPPPPPGYPPPGYQTAPAYVPPSRNTRTPAEMGTLYAFSVGYGVAVGVWFSAELGIEDPGVFLIPPVLLGVAAPAGVFFLDQPDMDYGLPGAMAAGMFVGAGAGLGIATYQFVSSDEEDEWSLRTFTRATLIGATLGTGAGYALGYFQEPPPESSLLIGSAAVWGSAIGAMYGYGASKAGIGYGLANDSAGLGGLIGFGAGVGLSAGLSALIVPSPEMIGWMWAGAGIGAAVSLPVFLFYTGEDAPPAKRGFLFMATASLLGLVAGGIFSSEEADFSAERSTSEYGFARLDYVMPAIAPDRVGIEVGGVLF